MSDLIIEESMTELQNGNKCYKYLYEIEQTHPKPGEPIYYRGARISQVPPEQDLWIKYFTSSRLVEKKIEEEGVNAFKIVEIKHMRDDCNILYEEHLYLTEVDARNNPMYFNQTSNEGYNTPQSCLRVCPYCYHKNYGNPFEHCSNCGNLMSEFSCPKCKSILTNPNQRCSCGYSRIDDINYRCPKCDNKLNSINERCSCGYSRTDDYNSKCLKCGNELKNAAKRCSCGYSRNDDIKFNCPNCDNVLNHPMERCSCGYSRHDDAHFNCPNCGNVLNHPMERCSCGHSRHDDVHRNCPKCGNELNSLNERCSCGHSRIDDYTSKCPKCESILTNPNQRCSCGYSRNDDIKFNCPNCDNVLNHPMERCSCGYSRHDDAHFNCPKCENILTNPNQRCSCGYSRIDDYTFNCKKCGLPIDSLHTRCNNCKIAKAGLGNWKEYNPIYQLILNEEIVFQGYKHLCIEFMINQLICSECTARNWLNGERSVFNPKQSSKKFVNNFKYAGLIAELIGYPDDNEDLEQ